LTHTITTGLASVPIFVDLPPNPGDVAALKYYHGVHGNPIYGKDFKPLFVPIPPDAVKMTVTAGVKTRGSSGSSASSTGTHTVDPPRRLSTTDVDATCKLIFAIWKRQKTESDNYQTYFDSFKAILAKYLSPQALREIEAPLNLRQIPETWQLLTTRSIKETDK
jgi:hypothetical protein